MPALPKPEGQRRRRNATIAMTQLPERHEGPLPEWPLEDPATSFEARVWRKLWTKPQAFMWERNQQDRIVARYVRLLVEAEAPGAQTTLLAEVRQLEDRLGLSPQAMLRLRWEVRPAEEVAEPSVAPVRRLRAIDPDAASS